MSKYCVLKGTKISLYNGTIKDIEQLKIGDKLIVFNIDNIANTQDEKILQNIKINNFNGLFKTSRVKNIWKNQRNHYFIINDKLKITGDHIILVQRNKTYYWTKVEKLQLNDLLFTEQNIFELITKIEEKNEPVKVYNIQVDTYYNFFANQYLIHNGAPCSSCADCGIQYITVPDGLQFEFVFDSTSLNDYGGISSHTTTKYYSTHDVNRYIEFTQNHILFNTTAAAYNDSSHPLYNNGATSGGGFQIAGGYSQNAVINLTQDLITAMGDTDSKTGRSLIYEVWWRFDKSLTNASGTNGGFDGVKNSYMWLLAIETGWGPGLALNDFRIGQDPDPPYGGLTNNNYDNYNIGMSPGFSYGSLKSNSGIANTDFSQKTISGRSGSSTTNRDWSSYTNNGFFGKWIHTIVEWKHDSNTPSNQTERTMWINGDRVEFKAYSMPAFDGRNTGWHGSNVLSVGTYDPNQAAGGVRHDASGVVVNTLRAYVTDTEDTQMTDAEATRLYNLGINTKFLSGNIDRTEVHLHNLQGFIYVPGHVATFIPNDYDSTNRVWYSRTNYGTHNTANKVVRSIDFHGTPTLETTNGISGKDYDGNSVTYPVFKGTRSQGCEFPTDVYSNDATYTLFHVSRYPSNATYRKRIFDGSDVNWLSGYWMGNRGIAYHEGWLVTSGKRPNPGTGLSDSGGGTNNGSTSIGGWNIITDRHNSIRFQGVEQGTGSGANGNGPTRITINAGIYGNGGTLSTYDERSEYEVAEVIFFNEELSNSNCEKIEQYLSYKYQISLNNAASPYSSLPSFSSGSVTSIQYVSEYAGWPYDNSSAALLADINGPVTPTSYSNDTGSEPPSSTYTLGGMVNGDLGYSTYNFTSASSAGATLASGHTWQTSSGNGLKIKLTTTLHQQGTNPILYYAPHYHPTQYSPFAYDCQVRIRYWNVSDIDLDEDNKGYGYNVGDIVGVLGVIKSTNCPNCRDEDNDVNSNHSHCSNNALWGPAGALTGSSYFYRRVLVKITGVQ